MIWLVVSDYKDTNFWKQFTTSSSSSSSFFSCFRLQRYKLLKAIHNFFCNIRSSRKVVSDYKDTNFWKQFTTISLFFIFCYLLFQTTKIQTFESNSQHCFPSQLHLQCCFRLQRYKLLKAIHNVFVNILLFHPVVSDYKDTNFWKQFTTVLQPHCVHC